MKRPPRIQLHTAAALKVQLAQPHLRLHVALVRQKLVVLNEVVVEDAIVRARVLQLVQQADPLN